MTYRLRNSPDGFGIVAIALHWLMALLAIVIFVIGWYMVGLDYYDPWYTRAPDWHKALGMLLFVMLLFRIYWRVSEPLPTKLASYQAWEVTLARLVHILFYVLLLLLSVTGYLIVTAKAAPLDILGWFSIPALTELPVEVAAFIESIHYYSAYGMIFLAILHTLAALKHHFIDRDSTLKRMLGIN